MIILSTHNRKYLTETIYKIHTSTSEVYTLQIFLKIKLLTQDFMQFLLKCLINVFTENKGVDCIKLSYNVIIYLLGEQY